MGVAWRWLIKRLKFRNAQARDVIVPTKAINELATASRRMQGKCELALAKVRSPLSSTDIS